ncbi:hypothetical protein HQ633_13005, partial [Enterococcus faecium]|nr:hypothetical protein [Enterococcus faecium]
TVTEPGKTTSTPVSVEIPGKKETAEATPAATKVEVSQDPTTGDVTLTPTTTDGKTYPKGTKVVVDGLNNNQPYEVDDQGHVTI